MLLFVNINVSLKKTSNKSKVCNYFFSEFYCNTK